MHDYQVRWSEEDQEFVATVSEYPSLSFLAPTQKEALDGLKALVADVEVDLILELTHPNPWEIAEIQDCRDV